MYNLEDYVDIRLEKWNLGNLGNIGLSNPIFGVHHLNLLSSNSFLQPILLAIDFFFKSLHFCLKQTHQIIFRI
jgi:hypothetical protein